MTKKRTTKSERESESENKDYSESETEPSKKKTATTTTKSKATTTTTKGKYPCWNDKRKNYNETYEEYWKRENDYFNACLAKKKAHQAVKEELDKQEFRNRCESLDFCFNPSEGRLIDYYLRSKNSDKEIAYCPIQEVDVYANNPRGLIENYLRNPGKVGYFFTRSRPNEVQSGDDVQGHWIFGKMEDVLNKGKKVGVKQVIEYCVGDHSTGYKIIEYQLHPAPVDQKAWFICKLCDDESCLVVQNQA